MEIDVPNEVWFMLLSQAFVDSFRMIICNDDGDDVDRNWTCRDHPQHEWMIGPSEIGEHVWMKLFTFPPFSGADADFHRRHPRDCYGR